MEGEQRVYRHYHCIKTLVYSYEPSGRITTVRRPLPLSRTPPEDYCGRYAVQPLIHGYTDAQVVDPTKAGQAWTIYDRPSGSECHEQRMSVIQYTPTIHADPRFANTTMRHSGPWDPWVSAQRCWKCVRQRAVPSLCHAETRLPWVALLTPSPSERSCCWPPPNYDIRTVSTISSARFVLLAVNTANLFVYTVHLRGQSFRLQIPMPLFQEYSMPPVEGRNDTRCHAVLSALWHSP